MKWSPQQQRGLDAVGRWLTQGTHHQQCYRLFGFAGTGKTTLATHIAEQAGGRVLFGAYTGKAASVLRSKGCAGAMTIHQMIYKPSDRSTARLRELQKTAADVTCPNELARLEREITNEQQRVKQPAFKVDPEAAAKDADVIIIDECSMVDSRMGEDLLSFGKPVLVLGDPAQLPPVFGGGFFTKHDPDMMLDEVHRQALDSPVLRLATMVRNRERLEFGQYGDSLVMDGRPDPEQVLKADQILVGTNKTRAASNQRIRDLSGYKAGPYPAEGEKLVCLRNDHEAGLLNGTLWKVDQVLTAPENDQIKLVVESPDSGRQEVTAHTHHFEGRGKELDPWTRKSAQEFDYGYALTVHKSQGSQWQNVFIFDESGAFRNARRQWLYTAITRAAETVTVVRNR